MRLLATLALLLALSACSGPKPGPCQSFATKDAQHMITKGRVGVVRAAMVATGRKDSHGEPVQVVAMATYQHQTVLLGHAGSPTERSAFWVALDQASEDATGFPGGTDGLVGDIADAVHADDITAAKACL